LAWAGAAHAADEAKTPKVDPHGFFAKYLAPRMTTGLNGEVDAAAHFANPAANPWTRDEGTVLRVERRAIHATKGAVKRYAIESLGLDAWSLPLVRGTGTGLDALRTDSGGARLLFGFSHMAPRAEVLIPVTSGRVAFSADAMGRMGVTFETPASSLRFGATVDPRAHSGGFALTSRF
jgi:hypothetical protein